MDELTDLTQCPVCFEEYQLDGYGAPKILPCSHTLCEKCLETLIRNNKVDCPECRTKHQAAAGRTSFPQNKYIIAHIKTQGKEGKAHPAELREEETSHAETMRAQVVSYGNSNPGNDQISLSSSARSHTVEKETRKAELIHYGVQCDGCNMSPLRGKRYKCATCYDYDLCESCEDQGTHPQHDMFHLIRDCKSCFVRPCDVNKLYLLPSATCDGCGNRITGKRYKCVTCYDYDLCETCENQGTHPQHGMLLIRKPTEQRERQQHDLNGGCIHYSVQCDGCDMMPLRGKRYKCRTCFDYDLCESCEKQGTHPQHDMFQLVRTYVPGASHVCNVNERFLLAAATCNGCDESITGKRYKCITCCDYDLCETCENQGTHPQHNMLLIRNPVNFVN